MDLLISVDEAGRLLGSADNSLADLISVVRGSGVGLDLSLQSTEVSKSVLRGRARTTSHSLRPGFDSVVPLWTGCVMLDIEQSHFGIGNFDLCPVLLHVQCSTYGQTAHRCGPANQG